MLGQSFCEHDVVVLAHDVAEHGLKAGDMGAIVHIYAEAAAYEVEFVAGDGTTIAVLTLKAADIRPQAQSEILHVRDLDAPADRGQTAGV